MQRRRKGVADMEASMSALHAGGHKKVVGMRSTAPKRRGGVGGECFHQRTAPAPDHSLPASLVEEVPGGPEKRKTESPASMSEPERLRNSKLEDPGPGNLSASRCILGTTNTLEAIEGLPDSLLIRGHQCESGSSTMPVCCLARPLYCRPARMLESWRCPPPAETSKAFVPFSWQQATK